ncbi:MAG TPA: signal peptidase I [Candidatus Paceibacterota bacterium]
MKTIFNIFYGVFIGLLITVGALFLISIVPFRNGIDTKIVQSGSMEPAVHVGALVFVRPSASYSVGDIITFGEDSASAVPTTHRVEGVRKVGTTEFYTTKGDANEEADQQEVANNEVIGKVFLSVPFAGFVLDFARQPLGFALLIAFPAFLVILAELVAIFQEVRFLRKPRKSRVRKSNKVQLKARTLEKSQAIEYVRQFAMDDVFVPMRILTDSTGQERHFFARHYIGSLTSTVTVVCVFLISSLQNTGATLSYFKDTETSSGNTFTAGTWEVGAGFIIEQTSAFGETTLVEDSPLDIEESESTEPEDQPIETGVENAPEEIAPVDEEVPSDEPTETENAGREREPREERVDEQTREEIRENQETVVTEARASEPIEETTTPETTE